MTHAESLGVRVTLTRSAGVDGAPVVFVDTDPNESRTANADRACGSCSTTSPCTRARPTCLSRKADEQADYYQAVMPQAAWKNGREPRERRRRRRAVDDLIERLGRYLEKQRYGVFLTPDPLLFEGTNGEPIRSEYTDRMRLAQWVSWAARLTDPHVRYGLGPAPDGSEWSISSRCELL